MIWLTSILAGIGALTIATLNVRRSHRRGKTLVCEIVRCLLIFAAIILFWRPESTLNRDDRRPRRLVVMVDHSQSMSTVDSDSNTGHQTPERISRLETAQRITEDPRWKQLDRRWELTIKKLFEKHPSESDLGGAIDRVISNEDVTACVLLSDGDWNSGASPLGVVQDLAIQEGRRFSLQSVAIGRPTRLPDLELYGVSCPTIAVEDKPLRLPFTVANWFPESRTAMVQMRVDGAVEQEQQVTIASGKRFDGSMQWTATGEGQHSIEISVVVAEGESDATNNQSAHQVDVRPESLRVLIVESKPRWEFRYLRNALIRDPGIEVSTLLFHPTLETVGGGGSDYLESFPNSVAELAEYDVIFLGDVGTGEHGLSEAHCQLLAGTVAEQATGIVLMPGPDGRQSELSATKIESLTPVVFDGSSRSSAGAASTAESTGKFALTESGRSSLLTQLSDQPADNWKLWQSLPGFQWFASATRGKTGSEVLAVHADAANQFGRLPLLVTRRYGAGKVLWMATDSAWRWRMGVEDKYHYRFWGQVIRWMAYGRNMAVGESMRLIYQPETPTVASSLSLRASVMTSSGEPSSEESVELTIEAPDQSRQIIRLTSSPGDWGTFVGETSFSQTGLHGVTLQHPSENETLKTQILVQGRAVEAIGRPARIDVMNDLARLGHGQAFQPNQVDSLVELLNSQLDQNQQTQTIRLWQHPLILLGMVAGLSLFWVLRKWAGAL
ncbi:hypothetical protein [Roseiconus lacunae]|uniref:hypothetical protein n=1 Tax=Roseiconus lacunae TaxID=2605694 RepID=UPI001E4A388A|nr:hypothetical protein [Roseiconus lacunae]MCD0458537.1 hypothetical protein [Roseiconus lacunae]